MFKRLKAVFGGGTTVETEVHTAVARPGGRLDGVIEVVGGDVEQEIRYLALALEARVEVETDNGEHHADERFASQQVHGAFPLHPGEQRSVPFSIDVPLETPFNVLGGRDLPGVRLGLRTELEIARSLDKGDFDPIRVAPLPAQERILATLERIGCRFRRSDLERGRIRGSALPFYQELEFTSPAEFARAVSELEVTFLAGPHGMDVLLEGVRRGGFLDAGGDRVVRLSVAYDAVERTDWESALRHHLQELGRRRGLFG
ncbi:sporulation protein [Pseudonocardia nigra]|uniref:sporulation protein n=1 Tax=Pseudonocardia nigra TaxID=1921578 RepID=UPI001C5FB2E1|nr:sporulation protein [Pseudonocardia nigra]